ncbi:MAG TPA: OmpH family outer membrane protein [Candidatus Saccharimonadales bacterium]|nr:OmpH family outer membrane protein [Candidatus Saccharimonadales bacterium]
MKRLFAKGAASLVLFCLASAAFAADQKIATVDLAKVFAKYYKTIQSNAALKLEASDMEKERKSMVEAQEKRKEDWRVLRDKAQDQAVSAEQREKSKKEAEEKFLDLKSGDDAINEYDRVASARLNEKQRQRRDDLVKSIREVLNGDAKAAGYTMVLDVSGESANMAPVVLFSTGVNDLTDALLKELNATAPAGTLDSK